MKKLIKFNMIFVKHVENKVLPYLFFVFILATLSCNVSLGQNIALHKKYILSETPNYSLTKGNDEYDLTDGVKKTGSKFWQDISTVGWKDANRIDIDIDLDGEKNISNVVINTARGNKAEVHYPANVFVFLSNDLQTYCYAGDIMTSLDNVSGGYEVREFILKNINIQAKYVKLVVIPNGKYTFLDEIEVIANRVESQSVSPPHNPVSSDSLSFMVKELLHSSSEFKETLNTIKKEMFFLLGEKSIYDNVNKKLATINLEDENALVTFRDELSQANINRISSKNDNVDFLLKPLLPWEEWSPLQLTELEKKGSFKVQLIGLKSSHQYVAFSIINTQKNEQLLSIDIPCDVSDIEFYEIPNSPNNTALGSYDALKPINENKISIKSGEKLYVYIKIKLERSCLSNITVESKNKKEKIPLSIEVINQKSNPKFLNANVWAYFDYPVIENNIDAVSMDLSSHHVNTIVLSGKYIPLIGNYDFEKLKAYLSNIKIKENYKILLFSNHLNEARQNLKSGESYMSESWKREFKKWYGSLVTELSDSGIEANQIYWYPYDEIKESNLNDFISLSKWGKQALPQMQLFVTINKEASSTVIPHATISQVIPSLGKKIKIKYPNSEIWIYDVLGNSRDRSAYSTYRLMAWEAFLYDFKGVGFWNYLDLRNGELNRYNEAVLNKAEDFSVVYTTKNNEIVSSRRWEAFSKGIEDHQVLEIYAEKYGERKTKDLVKEVLNKESRMEFADKVIYNMLKELEGKE